MKIILRIVLANGLDLGQNALFSFFFFSFFLFFCTSNLVVGHNFKTRIYVFSLRCTVIDFHVIDNLPQSRSEDVGLVNSMIFQGLPIPYSVVWCWDIDLDPYHSKMISKKLSILSKDYRFSQLSDSF